ncbi:MAG: hypothetical protein HS126_32755 [Anaerolineales bacterium]|nr:hypothetical protein [Anaerolineales bacterium]
MSIAINLVPIGPIPANLLSWLANRLEEVFNRQVVVYFSNILHDTDVKGFNFCQRCRTWLEKASR